MEFTMQKKRADFFSSLFLLIFLSILSFQSQAAADAVAKIVKLKGTVYAISADDEKRKLSFGKKIFEQDRIQTEKDSLAIILFKDKTRFELGAESSLTVSEYKYEQNAEQDSVKVDELKGAFRFVTGLVAKQKPESMKVGTAVATIGIRGTQVIGEADGTSATIILIEPEDESRKSAIDVYNDFGKVTIDEPGYGTEIPDANSPPSPPRRMRLQTINNLMRSMQNVNRVNVPRPRMP